jgi:hypothetical protein
MGSRAKDSRRISYFAWLRWVDCWAPRPTDMGLLDGMWALAVHSAVPWTRGKAESRAELEQDPPSQPTQICSVLSAAVGIAVIHASGPLSCLLGLLVLLLPWCISRGTYSISRHCLARLVQLSTHSSVILSVPIQLLVQMVGSDSGFLWIVRQRGRGEEHFSSTPLQASRRASFATRQ